MSLDWSVRVHEGSRWNHYERAWRKLDVDANIPQDKMSTFAWVKVAQSLYST